MKKVLVVDDEPSIVTLLTFNLEKEGYQVTSATDGAIGLQMGLNEAFDFIILDVMLPSIDGIEIMKRLRQEKIDTPILILTAKDDPIDRILGLEIGADDYLGKPFNPRELLARVHAVLRRRPAVEAPGAPSAENETVYFGRFVFDLSARTLKKDGVDLPLTTGEFAMLKALVRHPRQPLSREKLAQLARGREFEPFDRSLDVQVSRLRKLVENDPASPRYIQTVWGVGYVFVPDGDGSNN